VLSWEGDITAFVEEKARWGLDQYDSTRKRQGSVTSTGEESRSESRKVASRSQRYRKLLIRATLLAHILTTNRSQS
jgi:hypothetical protein